jgi:hypothetical protein
MSSTRVVSLGAVVIGFLMGVLGAAFPLTAHAAWVNNGAFQVGGALTTTIVPTNAGTSFVNPPTCDSQGGTSLALVPGLKLAGVDPIVNPVVLAVSCLDNGGSATVRSRLNFIGVDGKVVKQLSTTAVPSTGWAHLVYRPDRGDLLGCGTNGALYSIDISPDTSTIDGTAALVTPLPSAATSCKGLTWDAEADMIYLGLVQSGNGRVVGFKQGTSTPLLADFTNLPCIANGLAISGGVLLMSCQGAQTILRLDKASGVSLGANNVITATGLQPFNGPEPGLGDLACDPKTFLKDGTGKDLFRDALWSRRGDNGNGVVALEFPAFTCGMPSKSVVVSQNGAFSPLAAGLSFGTASLPGTVPRQECFANGQVIDTDGDGLPDCWEDPSVWPDAKRGIDFDGDNTRDLELCVQVNTNGDGVTLTQECADKNHKDLFSEIDYMQFHKPDPQALSQTQSVATVGVKSIREAFAAAPVANPDLTGGIRIHFQVDEQVTFTPLGGGAPTSHVNLIVFTPCTTSTVSDPTQAVDFDAIKAAHFGTAAERGNDKTVNAKRLAFRYVVFGHDLAPSPSGGGIGSSGCAEIGADDAAITLGSFSGSGTIPGHTGGVGSTDEQAGTLMHEFGHLLGLRHGGDDPVNCKPNYRSVMSYNRQLSGSPIVGRRLDYSRSQVIDLNENLLDEFVGLGVDPTLGPLPPYFPSADQIAFGPGAWSFAAATAAPINWNRSKFTSGPNKGLPSFQNNAAANLNDGSGCTSLDSTETLYGHDDWSNIQYRASAAIDVAGGKQEELTQLAAVDLFMGSDADSNGAKDGTDCGGTINPDGTTAFPCTHRIDIKPSFPLPKTIDPGAEANITVAIFSEKTGSQVWNASTQVLLNDLANFPLTFRVEPFETSVKVNNKGGGTCSISDVADPAGQKDGIKDLKCQFPTGPMPDGTTLPLGTHFGVVNGFFFDPITGENRAFTARQEVTIVD